MNSKAVLIEIILMALLAGCTGTRAPPPLLMATTGPLMVDPILIRGAVEGPVVTTPLVSAEIIPPPTALAPAEQTPVAPAFPGRPEIGIRPATGSPVNSSGPVVPAGTFGALSPGIAPAAKAAPSPAISPARAQAPAVVATVAPAVARPAPPAARTEATLDVAALKERLRNTGSIGVFTKLALKNQVDDLLTQFRTYHAGGRQSAITALREPYNTLVGKVLSLIEGGDPSLAHTISGSREAIWSILADPEKFKTIT